MQKQYTILLKKSGNHWVSLGLELMVVGSGKSRKEAIATIKDAIESYISAMDDDGLSPESPVPLDVLHRFLAGEKPVEIESAGKMTAEVGVYAYGTA